MSRKNKVKRCFVIVGERHVHYRRSGSGPPVVLLHESPKSSFVHMSLIRFLAKSFTVFAFDTPGFGESDPLAKDKKNVRDFADALAETLAVLQMPRSAVFGNHTGASIALELGRRHPTRVSGLVLESLPIFRPSETKGILKHFFPPLKPKWDGSHLTSVWSRVRDQYIWFPWFKREFSAIHGWPMPTPEIVHDYAMDFFRAGDAYRYGYAAAFRYASLPAIKALTVPAIFVALKGDILEPHIDRLPKLRPHQSIQRVNTTGQRRHLAIKKYMSKFARGNPPKVLRSVHGGSRVTRSYVDLANGQIHVRSVFKQRGRPLFMVHDFPGSSLRLENLLNSLGRRRSTVAVDLPGCGGSDDLNVESLSIAKYAAAFTEVVRTLGLTSIDLYGKGLGGYVVIELAVRNEALVNKVVLDQVPPISSQNLSMLRSSYAPKIVIQPDGSHLYRTWLMLRDQLVFWPWFEKGTNVLLHTRSDFDPNQLQRWVIDILDHRETYHKPLQLAFNYKSANRIKKVRRPILILSQHKEMIEKSLTKDINSIYPVKLVDLKTSDQTIVETINGFLEDT